MIKQGCSGDVQVCVIRCDDEIGVVLSCKVLNCFDCFVGVGLVVIFDDFDYFLVVIDYQVVFGVYLIGLKGDVWLLCYCCIISQIVGFWGDCINFDYV